MGDSLLLLRLRAAGGLVVGDVWHAPAQPRGIICFNSPFAGFVRYWNYSNRPNVVENACSILRMVLALEEVRVQRLSTHASPGGLPFLTRRCPLAFYQATSIQ